MLLFLSLLYFDTISLFYFLIKLDPVYTFVFVFTILCSISSGFSFTIALNGRVDTEVHGLAKLSVQWAKLQRPASALRTLYEMFFQCSNQENATRLTLMIRFDSIV